MAIPLTVGANPEIAEITDLKQWILIFTNLNSARTKLRDPEEHVVYLTYKLVNDPAPINLIDQPIWRLNTPPIKFGDGKTLRDIYVYVDSNNPVTLELEA